MNSKDVQLDYTALTIASEKGHDGIVRFLQRK